MKFSLQQLQKINQFPHSLNLVLDYQDKLKGSDQEESDTEVLDIKEVQVSIIINKMDNDTFKWDYQVSTVLILPCALTLEPVIFPINLEYCEIYTNSRELLNSNDDYFPFENNTIDIKRIVWDNIISSIPIRVVREDAYEILKSRNIQLNENIEDLN